MLSATSSQTDANPSSSFLTIGLSVCSASFRRKAAWPRRPPGQFCWIWPQSCRSPASASSSGSPSNPQSQTVSQPLVPPRRPQQPGSLEPADRSNTPLPASSVREGHRILFAALCESLRFTENGKCSSGMGDLFGEPELPAGFRYIPDVISTADEKSLVQRFEKLPLKPFEFHGHQGNRRIYTFGHRYVFAGQEPRADASIPDYLLPLTDVASQISGVPAEAFEQLMVTEYAPGAGIGWHRDRPSYEDIVAVSFLTPCTLRLRRKVGEDWERRSAHIEPRSVYLLHGPVRNVWQPSLAPMAVVGASVTLRTFRPDRSSSSD